MEQSTAMTMDGIIKAAQMKAFDQARAWLRRPYVRALALGMRKRAGRYVEDELCVIVTIDRKIPPHEISLAGRQAFPSTIRVQVGRRTLEVSVDVQVSEARYGRVHGLPGRRLGVVKDEELEPLGTVGLVVVGEDSEQYVFTAGHVVEPWFGSSNREFVIKGTQVELHPYRCAWTPRYDYALLKIMRNTVLRPAALPNGASVTGCADPRDVAEGDECALFRAGHSKPTYTVVRNPYATSPFRDKLTGKVVTMQGLIAVDARTVEGDSGTALLDQDLRVIGALVGEFNGLDHFCPCADLFASGKYRLA